MNRLVLPVAALALSYLAFFREARASDIVGMLPGSSQSEKIYNMYAGILESESKRLDIPLSTCVAVIAVESSGNPFGPDGRLTIRFEDHKFRKFSGDSSFYATNGSQSHEYDVLAKAIEIDEDAAYQSISMGAAQIMGFNCEVIGFDSAKEMFEVFQFSKDNQIVGFFKFMEFYMDGVLLTAARNNDFLTFANLYNGKGHKGYDAKIMKAKNDFIAKTGIE